MNIDPVIPIPVMAVICILMIVLKRKAVIPYIRQIIAVILLFAVNLRIGIMSDSVPQASRAIDVLLVVDNTISMLAEDYDGDDRRIDAVKEDVAAIVEQFAGSRIALITFDDKSEIAVPYTYDADMIMNAVDALDGCTMYYAQGTSLNICYDDMERLLSRNVENDVDGNLNAQVVIFISDGEITKRDKLKDFSDLDEYIDAGVVLGYGTDDGGPMKVRTYALDEDYTYLKYYDDNFNYVTAISKIDESNLKDIASDLDVEYYHMTDHSDMDDVLDTLQLGLEDIQIERNTGNTGEGVVSISWIFAIPLMCIIAYDFIYYRKKMG